MKSQSPRDCPGLGRRAVAAVSLLTLACLHPRAAVAQDQWVQAGPAGAAVAALAVDPSNPSIVYAGLLDQGVYRTVDGGAHWTALNTGLTNLAIRGLAIDPLTPSILYVVANDGLVQRSTNAGTSWNPANGGLPPLPVEPSTPFSLAVDPVTPSRLYFSTGPGIYRSTNSGQTWELHDTGLPPGKEGLIYSFAINPMTPSTVYAGGRGRVFRSTNGGDSWAQISDSSLHQNAGRQALAIDPITPTTLYYCGNELTSGGVWRSLDGGVTWSHRLGGPIGSLAVDPVTHSTVYAGTFFAGVWKSIDSGGTWQRADTGMYPRGQISALGISPLLPTRVYAGSLGGSGVFRTDNAAATWAPANAGLFAIGIGQLTVHPATPSTVFAIGGGVMRSADMGRNWTFDPMPPGALAVDPSTPATIYSATESGVFRTTDGGATWAWVLNVSGTRAIAIDPGAPSTVYAASTEPAIFKSTDRGDTWTNMSAGLPAAPASWMQIVIDPVQPSTIYLTAWRVYKTVNAGVGWIEASNGMPASGVAVTSLAIDPLDPSRLYAATNLGVFRTANGGGVWDPVSALPSTWASAVAIDPVNSANIYAAYGGFGLPGAGIFRSTNGGTSWSPMNTGLTDTSITALAIDPFTPSILYAGTASRSAFRWQPDGVRRLAVTKPGTGAGTVTASAGSLQCGADCVEEYAIGTVVTLSAVAQSPSTFSGFGGDADCVDGSVTLTDNRTCSAIFSLPKYVLTVTVGGTGTGSVTSSPAGINCGSDCQELYDHGTVVTLTAAPAPGWLFGTWGGACAGSALACQVTVNQARTVTARFDPTAPGPFVKLGPADGATGLQWVNGLLFATLSWQIAVRATSYEYCFDTINNSACDTAWVTAPLTQGAVTSQLTVATTYFWQVRAVNSAGSVLANNGVWWSFRTTDGSPPGGFAKIAPAPGTVVHPARVILSWQPSVGATSYEFCSVPTQIFNCLPVWTSTSGTSAVITGLSSSTQYLWRVRARNAYGTTESQLTWAFTTAAAGEDLALDLGAALGLWVMGGGGAWQHVHGLSPESILRADLDGNGADDLVIDFGPQLGVWVWMNHASWRHLHGLSPTQMVAGDFDGNGLDDLVLDFPGLGLWRFSNNASWTHLHGSSAARLAVGNLDGAGGHELLVSFTNGGLWICSGTGVWSLVHGSNVIALVAADLDGNGQDDLVVSFAGGLGLWTRQNQNLWTQLHGLAPVQVLAARLDANSQADLVVNFGSGMGVWTLRNRTAWALLQGAPVEGIETLDRDGDGLDDIVIDLGPAVGLWQYGDDGVWTLLHSLSPEGLAAGRFR